MNTMNIVKVAAAVLNQTPLDWDGNKRNILSALEAAREAKATIVCLPELCITGYGCEDAFLSPGLQATALAVLEEIVPQTRGMIVSVGLPLYHAGCVFNAAAVIVDGALRGMVCKQNLAGEGIHYEPRWFKAWPNGAQAELRRGDRVVPIGDLIFDCGGVQLGFEICEDAWVAERPGSQLARKGVDIILNPSASHFAFGKHEVRKRFVLEGSRAFNVGYVYANLVGNEAGRAIYDGDAMIAANGNFLAQGPRFSYGDFAITTATVDLDGVRMNRARTASFRPFIDEDPAGVVRVPFAHPPCAMEPQATSVPRWELSPCIKEEEFSRAVSLALFDYMRKSRSRGYVVSLSGGADSAACSVLVARMIEYARSEIGIAGLRDKLQYIPDLPKSDDPGDWVARLLTCVYQSTRNSSDTTRNAARAVAEGVGANFLEFDVDAQVQGYIEMVEQGIGRQLDWKKDDVALQNIQARTRAPSVWMLTNILGALLISTSNRSEAAVGYATMDGDTSGGLAPIAGIDKNYLRHWLRWMEKAGPDGFGPLPSLSAVNVQPPTAELRPSSAKQTDEDDLMPYDVLDAAERAAIRDKKTPLETLIQLRQRFPQYTVNALAPWVERFFTLWCRNQWKRERYAPSFHLDDENLDPKTWCRFPILSGGYRREIAEMQEWARQNPDKT